VEYASFLTRRTGQAILVLLGLSVLMFVLARIVPGDPGRLALGPTATSEQVKGLDHDFGLDQPLWVQYAKYLGNASHGDFGTALLTRRGVAQDMKDSFPATLELVLASTTIVVGLGDTIAGFGRRGRARLSAWDCASTDLRLLVGHPANQRPTRSQPPVLYIPDRNGCSGLNSAG
jgi:ABC-type dipeptide/oligopeptide/nickel transport system permease component